MKHRRLILSTGLPIAVVLLFALPSLVRSQYWLHVLVLATITVVMAVSLRCLARIGLVSMGSAGFMLVGAYASALLGMRGGLSVWLAIPLGALVAAVIAFVASIPFLRAKGIYFAILTVMLAETLRMIAWYWPGLTGGLFGPNGHTHSESHQVPGPRHYQL